MSKLAGNTRAALLGVVFAMVGFSYAIASFSDGGPGVGNRATGSNPLKASGLHFTNPFVPNNFPAPLTDRDLGDIVAGSGFVRYCRAAGGVPPYKFSSTITPTLKSIITTADVFKNGAVIGTTASTFNTTPVRFNVTVSDLSTSSASKTEFFRLTLVPGGTYRFSTDSLPEATQLRDYITKIEMLNGTPASFATTIDILTSTVPGITASSKLEDVGLTLADDGTLFGKPTKSGFLVFLCTSKNTQGVNALGRFPSTLPGQSFTLNITANTTVASDIFATGIGIKVTKGAVGKDSIKYAGIANLSGASISSLAGSTVTLRIGKYVSPGNTNTPNTLDAKGKTVKGPKAPKGTIFVTLKGSVSSKGQVKIALGKETLDSAAKIFEGTDTFVVNVQVGPINATEVLSFTRKASSKGFSLTYKLGTNVNIAGGLLVLSVAGKDDAKATADFDAWKVAFLAQGQGTSAGASGNFKAGSFAGTQSASVFIGEGFGDDIGMAVGKGSVKSTDKKKPTDPEVLKLAMSEKGKGSLQTGFLAGTATGIKAAKSGQTSANFALGITLNGAAGAQVFSGVGGAALFNKSNKSWTSANPTK